MSTSYLEAKHRRILPLLPLVYPSEALEVNYLQIVTLFPVSLVCSIDTLMQSGQEISSPGGEDPTGS